MWVLFRDDYGIRKRQISLQYHSLIPSMYRHDVNSIGRIISRDTDTPALPQIRNFVIGDHHKKIQREINLLCSNADKFHLRYHTEGALCDFSWNSLHSEFEQRAPLFLQFLHAVCLLDGLDRNQIKTKDACIPAMMSVACKVLSIQNQEMSLLKYDNSFLLLKGGAKKGLFLRLNATHDCMSYSSTLELAQQLSNNIIARLNQWKLAAENGDGDGYYSVGDNLDLRVQCRYQSSSSSVKDEHMYQIAAYKIRVSGKAFKNVEKVHSSSVDYSTLSPDKDTRHGLKCRFAHHVVANWCKFIPSFQKYSNDIPRVITHEHIDETCSKTDRLNVGVLKKNENETDQMTDICQYKHQFVPNHGREDEGKSLIPIISGGDYLTHERTEGSQSGMANSLTPSGRLEGLISRFEEFHNQMELLTIIKQILWDEASSKDIGTIVQGRGATKSSRANENPAKDYYASSNLMEKVT